MGSALCRVARGRNRGLFLDAMSHAWLVESAIEHRVTPREDVRRQFLGRGRRLDQGVPGEGWEEENGAGARGSGSGERLALTQAGTEAARGAACRRRGKARARAAAGAGRFRQEWDLRIDRTGWCEAARAA